MKNLERWLAVVDFQSRIEVGEKQLQGHFNRVAFRRKLRLSFSFLFAFPIVKNTNKYSVIILKVF